MQDLDFSAELYQKLLDNCNFSEKEKQIIELRRMNIYNNDGIGLKVGYNGGTITKKMKVIKCKITREVKSWNTEERKQIPRAFNLKKWENIIFGGKKDDY